MKRIDFSRLMGMAAGMALGVTAGLTSATEVVRDSAGNLAPDYVQIYFPGINVTGIYVEAFYSVKRVSDNTQVCLSFLYEHPGVPYCMNWYAAGYTPTGNGYEVIRN